MDKTCQVQRGQNPSGTDQEVPVSETARSGFAESETRFAGLPTAAREVGARDGRASFADGLLRKRDDGAHGHRVVHVDGVCVLLRTARTNSRSSSRSVPPCEPRQPEIGAPSTRSARTAPGTGRRVPTPGNAGCGHAGRPGCGLPHRRRGSPAPSNDCRKGAAIACRSNDDGAAFVGAHDAGDNIALGVTQFGVGMVGAEGARKVVVNAARIGGGGVRCAKASPQLISSQLRTGPRAWWGTDRRSAR